MATTGFIAPEVIIIGVASDTKTVTMIIIESAEEIEEIEPRIDRIDIDRTVFQPTNVYY